MGPPYWRGVVHAPEATARSAPAVARRTRAEKRRWIMTSEVLHRLQHLDDESRTRLDQRRADRVSCNGDASVVGAENPCVQRIVDELIRIVARRRARRV